MFGLEFFSEHYFIETRILQTLVLLMLHFDKLWVLLNSISEVLQVFLYVLETFDFVTHLGATLFVEEAADYLLGLQEVALYELCDV